MRAGIARIPDGTYSFADRYDCPEIDGELDLSCTIAVQGEEMHLAFDGSPQVRAGLNMTFTALLSTVYYAVKSLVDPTILPNAGLARPLHVTAPTGTIVNCVHPAAVNGRLGTCQRVVDLIFGALAPATPDSVIAASNGACTSVTFAGSRPGSNALWVYLETIGGGSGARASKDGLDGVHVHMTNTSNLPVEALEREYPLTLLRYELVDGSAGAGRYRGGMGLRRTYRAETECRVRVDIARVLSEPWGLFGGAPAAALPSTPPARSIMAVSPCIRATRWRSSPPAPGVIRAHRNQTDGGVAHIRIPANNRPPSMGTIDPVKYDASCETRNATTPATSSAVPSLPTGMRRSLSERASCVSAVFRKSVAIVPGAIALTPTPCGASSKAMTRVNASSAALLAA